MVFIEYINGINHCVMKYFIAFFLLIFCNEVIAQRRLAKIYIPSQQHLQHTENSMRLRSSFISLNLPTNLKLYSVATVSGVFHKTYLVNSEGETVSDGFMPSSYFRSNDNLFVLARQPNYLNDSLNPYGAIDIPTMLFLAALNKYVGKLRIKRK